KPAQHLPNVLSVAQAHELVEEPGLSTRDRAVVELLYGAGLRVGELEALDRDDVDLSQGMVRVRRGKGGKERRVPMGPHAAEALRAWLGTRDDASTALFLNARGGRLGQRSIRRIIDQAGR